ncbi:MAG: hypothetical protein ABEJ40_00035 [Haloarculaceae archaeon]
MAAGSQGGDETAGGDAFGWRGWVVVGALVVALVVVPWAIVFLPNARGALDAVGFGLRGTYLVLPLVPAVGLGALAVWAALAHRRRNGGGPDR